MVLVVARVHEQSAVSCKKLVKFHNLHEGNGQTQGGDVHGSYFACLIEKTVWIHRLNVELGGPTVSLLTIAIAMCCDADYACPLMQTVHGRCVNVRHSYVNCLMKRNVQMHHRTVKANSILSWDRSSKPTV